jgi:ABC-type lipoprotein release transport system permease subunit
VAYVINTLLAAKGINFGIEFSYGGMSFETFKSEINARSFYIPAITIILSSLVVGFFPALKAARTKAARSMRVH